MIDYKWKTSELVTNREYSSWKYSYDSLLNSIAVQAAEHVSASTVMTTGFGNYLFEYKKKNRPDAGTQLIKMHKTFNKDIQ